MTDQAASDGFRLGQFAASRVFTGLVIGDTVFDLAALSAGAQPEGQLPAFGTLQDLLGDWDRNFERICRLADAAANADLRFALSDLTPLPPIARPTRMLYAAANYRDHVAGMQKTFTPKIPTAEPTKPVEQRPYLFVKTCEPTGAHADILLPTGLNRIDWEAELGVVIGQEGRRIRPGAVADHIAGYVATNDVSCRDLTWREDRPALRSDWLSGKSFDSFAPMGPFFTPKAFVPDHANLSIRLWVNGDLKQDGNSRDMIFGVEDQISYASDMITLRPGDIFATGTPAGTGQERLEFLADGDVVEMEIELCGRMRNRAVAEIGEANA